ncbi:MAG TPA: DUF3500 domain-containing protein, partial [Tepidisphaeraceae bacterium]|nr:DUF3500 domain-containing protein [Tepidisphaeraceae bacterium]
AANNLLATYTPEQKQAGVFELSDAERVNWHFIPRTRKGIPFKDLSTAQRPLAQALLSSGLSQRGFATAVTIMSLEQILLELEAGKGPKRDPENYAVSIFGKPGSEQAWGWRVEGHHLSLNFTIVEGKAVAASPNFFGSNPAEVKDGPRKGLRVLDQEEDLGRALAQSLSEEQKKTGILTGDAPKDIITANSRKATLLTPEGIGARELSAAQKQMLLGLISAYANRMRGDVAEQDMQKIQAAGFEKVHFAWAGGMEPGKLHYYRVQGPTFLIEYDNTQGNGNHVHSVWRDMTNDFGDDILKRHYEEHHQN